MTSNCDSISSICVSLVILDSKHFLSKSLFSLLLSVEHGIED